MIMMVLNWLPAIMAAASFRQRRRQRLGSFDHAVQLLLVDADDGHQAEDGEDAAADQAAQGPGQQGVALPDPLVFLAQQIDRQRGAQRDPEHEKQVEQVQTGKMERIPENPPPKKTLLPRPFS